MFFTNSFVYVIVIPMLLEERINQDFITSRKAKDAARSQFLSFVRAEMKNYAIDAKKEHLDDPEVLAILKKQKKRISDARDAVASSGRQDTIAELDAELAILDTYLPAPLEDTQVEGVVDEIIASVGASTIKDMGKVMKEVMAKIGAQVEAKKVSELVRSKLTTP